MEVAKRTGIGPVASHRNDTNRLSRMNWPFWGLIFSRFQRNWSLSSSPSFATGLKLPWRSFLRILISPQLPENDAGYCWNSTLWLYDGNNSDDEAFLLLKTQLFTMVVDQVSGMFSEPITREEKGFLRRLWAFPASWCNLARLLCWRRGDSETIILLLL